MSYKKQRGSTMVLVVVGLSALIAMGGLALDTAHVYLNTARLQTALDAAALAGAKTLDQSTSTVVATAAAQNVFATNVSNYPELNKAGVSLLTEFSASNNPFAAGSSPATFVRTSVTGFKTTMSVVSVLGIPSISVAGTAVAGPSASDSTACNLTPLVVCANPASPAPYFGYAADQVVGLTQLTTLSTTAGVGNYVVLNTGTSATAALAGDYTGCATAGTVVSTSPGAPAVPNTSVCGGLNTRFGNYTTFGTAAKYPPDTINSASHCTGLTTNPSGHVCQGSTVVTTASQLNFNHASYCSLNQNQTYDAKPITPATTSGAQGGFTRRVVPVVLADCTGAVNGKTSATVLGFACMFMLQQVSATDTSSTIYAQILANCNTRGKASTAAATNTGPHTIQLYHSSGSKDS
jgi:Putative Flp pilus-assembly TadE/G-like